MLKTRKRSILSSFELISKFVEEFNPEEHAAEVPVRLEHVVHLWGEYNAIQGELETLDETPKALDAYLQERATVETRYYHVKGFLLEHNQHVSSSNAQSVGVFSAR